MGIKTTFIRTAARTGLMLKKHSPEILTVSGIVLGVAATVHAAMASRNVNDIQAVHQHNIEAIQANREIVVKHPDEGLEYTENEAASDTKVVYYQTFAAYAKLYAPTVILTGLSIACILSAHHILDSRYTAAAAAFSAVSSKFKDYRGRVVEAYGEAKDREFMNGIRTITETNAKGKVVKEEKVRDKDVVLSDTERFFDEFSPLWDSYNPEMNVAQLRTVIQRANDELDIRGHLFLNEVYDMLGIPRTKAGSIMGWVRDDNSTENFVDFGVFNGTEDPWDFENDCPWDGHNGILLHFNVDDDFIFDRI